MEDKLLEFLKRIPWSSKDLLEQYFGPNELQQMLDMAGEEIVSIDYSDGKTYYSAQPANYRLIPGIPRREMVRKQMSHLYGYTIFDRAESPCFNADFRSCDEIGENWIRSWGDMGNISPDSLLFAVNPPAFGTNMLDVVVTRGNRERASFLRVQIEINWKNAGSNNVQVISLEDEITITPKMINEHSMGKYDPTMESYPKLPSHFNDLYNSTDKNIISMQEVKSLNICHKCIELAALDIRMLIFIACNPFLTKPEIGLLLGGDSSDCDSVKLCEREYNRIMEIIARLDYLTRQRLLKHIVSGPMKDTYILTWESIDILAGYYGTIPAYLKKYSALPLQAFNEGDFIDNASNLRGKFPYFDSHCFYKQRWGVIRPEHQTLIKEVTSAFFCGARSLKSEFKYDVNASGLSTISTNLKMSYRYNRKNLFRSLCPDASFNLYYSSGNGMKKKMKVFLEIERNTNHKNIVLGKIDKYRKFIPAAESFYKDYDEIAVVFLYDDTDADPGMIMDKTTSLLKEMQIWHISGYVGLLSDAKKVPEGWIPKHGEIEMNTCGNMYVYQKMWRTSLDDDYCQKHTLFDYHQSDDPEYYKLSWVKENLKQQGKFWNGRRISNINYQEED